MLYFPGFLCIALKNPIIALKSAVVPRIFVHSALRNPRIAFRTAVISRIFVHRALKSAVVSRIFVHSALRNPAARAILVSILSLSQEDSPQFPCPSRRRFQVAIAAFGPFWGKI